jgi:hypothetical protein
MTLQINLVRRGLCGLVLCWLGFSAIPATIADAEDLGPQKTVEVVGTSPFSESDPAAMRETALQNGLRAAVVEVATEAVGAQFFAGNAAAIRKTLLAKSQRFILSYRVIEEGRVDETYQVLVQAAVSVGLIDETLRRTGIIRQAESLPAVLFLTSQQSLEKEIPRYWWSGTSQDEEFAAENAMVQALAESGFEIVRRSAPGVRVAAARQRFTPDPKDRAAADIGLRIGADVVVVGRSSALATSGPGAQGPRTFTATASLRALEVPSADLLAQTAENFVTVDTDDHAGAIKALAGVGEKAGRSLAALLRPAWINRANKAPALRLEVEGTRALRDFVRFRKILKVTVGIRGIQLERLQANQAVISVDMDGDAQALAAKLMANQYPSFRVDIYEVSRKILKIRLVNTTGPGDSSQPLA